VKKRLVYLLTNSYVFFFAFFSVGTVNAHGSIRTTIVLNGLQVEAGEEIEAVAVVAVIDSGPQRVAIGPAVRRAQGIRGLGLWAVIRAGHDLLVSNLEGSASGRGRRYVGEKTGVVVCIQFARHVGARLAEGLVDARALVGAQLTGPPDPSVARASGHAT